MRWARGGGARIRFFAASAAIVLVCLANGSQAHHGTFTFDGDTVVALEGTVVQNGWSNPHSFIVLSVRDPGGSTKEVVLEADGPSLLRPLGVTRDSLSAGDRIVFYASPSRRADSDEYLAREALKADGTVVPLSVRYAREREAAEPAVAASVIGVWVPDRASLFSFVPWRATWALTDKGQAALASYDTRENFNQAQCIPATAPTVMIYPTAKVIEDRGDQLWLNADWMGATRTINMDGSEPPPVDERYLQGYSIGRWDGTALVVETTNFTDNEIGNAFGVPSGAGKRIVERLTLSDDRTSLRYSFVLEDPEYLAEPVSNAFNWHYRPDVSASTVECDLEAASHFLEE